MPGRYDDDFHEEQGYETFDDWFEAWEREDARRSAIEEYELEMEEEWKNFSIVDCNSEENLRNYLKCFILKDCPSNQCSGQMILKINFTYSTLFWGCSNYPECNCSSSLLSNSETRKKCPKCGLSVFSVKVSSNNDVTFICGNAKCNNIITISHNDIIESIRKINNYDTCDHDDKYFLAKLDSEPYEKIGLDHHGYYIDYPENFRANNDACIEIEICRVQIGDQEWMSKNLDVECYRNGDIIPQVTDSNEWENLTTGAWCYYNNDPQLGKVYGKLYNWYAVTDPRGLAPAGWKIPCNIDWNTLVKNLGGSDIAGGKLKEVGTAHWISPNTGSTNSSGFSALPGGAREIGGKDEYEPWRTYFVFKGLGSFSYWWSSTDYYPSTAYYISLIPEWQWLLNSSCDKRTGFYVRCVKNLPQALTPPLSIEDEM